MSLSARIMNISVEAGLGLIGASRDEQSGYRRGHRDARHAAAELADEADAILDELVAALEEAFALAMVIDDGFAGQDAAEARLRAAIARAGLQK